MPNAVVVQGRPTFQSLAAQLFHVNPKPNLSKHQIELKRQAEELAKKRQAERREELRGKQCETWNTKTIPEKQAERNAQKVIADVPTHITPLSDRDRKLLAGLPKKQ